MDYIKIISYIATVIFGGLSLYFKANKEIINEAVKYINEAEDKYIDTTKAGNQKFEYVVNKLYSLIPVAIRPFITKEFVALIVQNIFDSMQSYAIKQLDTIIERIGVTDKRDEKAEV